MIKKLLTVILFIFLSGTTFAQTKKVSEKKLVKTLETNRNENIIFVSEISLKELTINTDGLINLPLLRESNISLYSDLDTTFLKERIDYSKQKKFKITIEIKNINEQLYLLKDIEGIETVTEYKVRLEKERKENMLKQPIQVVIPTLQNITGSEQNWLGGQIQDKLKSNLQDYLGMKIVVDTKSEMLLKKIQQESESEARDETTSIEIGKITTAKFALFTTIRKTNKGYSITADFTDLTTGEQFASAVTKEYVKIEYLYANTGAIDELTLLLAEKIGVKLTEEKRTVLKSGTTYLTIEAQLALAQQNERQYKLLMNQYDEQLQILSVSADKNSEDSKRKIEAEKALLIEKQKSEEKRLLELENQKRQAEFDKELESQRSIDLKNQRDELANLVEAKAKEIRQLSIEKQGVLGEINLIENKKRALIEIRQSAEQRCIELYNQYQKDKYSEEEQIKNKPFTSVELESGKPIKSALQRRNNQIIASSEKLYNQFIADTQSIRNAISSQENTLLDEIRTDQKNLGKIRTVSSLGEELKITYGNYSEEKKGWNAYISLYSEGFLLYNGVFIISYESLVGKKAPNLATELNDTIINEYSNNVDMYNSLFARGTPLLHFELYYTVKAENDDKPSSYIFDLISIQVFYNLNNESLQKSILNKTISKTIQPIQNIGTYEGIVDKEKRLFQLYKRYISIGHDYDTAKKMLIENGQLNETYKDSFVHIPGKNIVMLKTEVTQELYESVMGSNPSCFKGKNKPVENIYWYDTVIFCNKLSKMFGYTPVYTIDEDRFRFDKFKAIKRNRNADGFRLPSESEWLYSALGGKTNQYSGSNTIEKVAWYRDNSNESTHDVKTKEQNDYGLYDMSGNVYECCDYYSEYGDSVSAFGGSFRDYDKNCKIDKNMDMSVPLWMHYNYVGFRIVRTVKE